MRRAGWMVAAYVLLGIGLAFAQGRQARGDALALKPQLQRQRFRIKTLQAAGFVVTASMVEQREPQRQHFRTAEPCAPCRDGQCHIVGQSVINPEPFPA